MEYRRELPIPSSEAPLAPPLVSRQDDVTSFLEQLSNRMKSGEDVNPEDITKFQALMKNAQSNPQQAERMRNALQGDEMMEKMVEKVSNKRNVHGQQQPSRKKMIKAQKNAKKAMSAASLANRGKQFKAVRVTRSRQFKTINLTSGNELEEIGQLFRNNVNACMWGELVVVYMPEFGHFRNKLIEKIFSRDAMLGSEVVIFRHDVDTVEKDVQALSKKAKEPSVYEPPHLDIEKVPEGEEELDEAEEEAMKSLMNENTPEEIIEERKEENGDDIIEERKEENGDEIIEEHLE